MHSQKYNPEVPTLQINNNDRLHQLNDQLITLKNMVTKQVRRRFLLRILIRAAFRRCQSRFISAGKWGQLILIFISPCTTQTKLTIFCQFSIFRWLICQDQTVIRCCQTWLRMGRPIITTKMEATAAMTTTTTCPALAICLVSFHKKCCCW